MLKELRGEGGGEKMQLKSKCFWKEKKNTKNIIKLSWGKELPIICRFSFFTGGLGT